MTNDAHPPGLLSGAEYRAIAGFRHELRRFMAFSETAAAREGLPAQQHQVLLAIAGRPSGEPASVGYIAAQLLVAPHTAAELTSRMVEGGLLTKEPSIDDRRRAELRLTGEAERLLAHLTNTHLEELKTLEPALIRALKSAAAARP